MPKLNFNPEKDIPSLDGNESAVSLAVHNPAHIFFTGRSQSSADKLLKAVDTKHPKTKITFIQCDQTSLASVQEAARTITSKTDRLDIAILNAGVMALPPGQTKEGYEVQFGTNHVAHALLIKLLLPLLSLPIPPLWRIPFDSLHTSQASIVWWSSFFGGWYRYGQSKLANLLYARAFAQRHPNITSVAIHPGMSATGLVTNLPWTQKLFIYLTTIGQLIPPEKCAWNQQWAATCPKERLESGEFYEPVGEKGRLNGEAKNDELAGKLYEWTKKELERWTLS